MARYCGKDCDPEVDNTDIECDGDFVSEECIFLKQNTYFNLSLGASLTSLIAKIVLKFKSIDIGKVNKNSPVFADDASAQAGGVLIGDTYVTPTGFFKRRMS